MRNMKVLGCKRPNNITSSPWVKLLLVVAIMCILPLFLSKGWLGLVAEMLILALAAAGLNLILGDCGLVSFGHAGFFGLGAYVFGLLSVYHYVPFGVAFALAVIAVILWSFIVGWFVVRLVEIYFALLCLAFGQVVWVFARISYAITGGDDGLIGIPIPSILSSANASYYFILAIVAVCLFLLYLVRESPFGLALHALRENRTRAGCIGINTKWYIYRAFVISGTFTGIAGILMTFFLRCAFPGYAGFIKSGELLFICLIGGIYNFSGPIVGAFLYMVLDHIVTGFTEYWPLFMGFGIVLIAVFFRGGVVGFVMQRYRDFKLKRGEVR